MKAYNSLSRKVEEIKPLHDGEIKLYTCGPTVYDHVHIGNLRTYIFEDILRRALSANGYKLTHVMNITDVDDKTIQRASRHYPDDEPQVGLAKLTRHYEDLFYDDAKKVGIDFKQSKIVRATDHIKAMQSLIRQIKHKYISDDGIYYDLNQDQDYGVLVKLDRSHAHHRINNDEYDKDHVADFALWKTKTEAEPAWDFKIDGKNMAGRPGWHIECSAMSVEYLGQPFDIHTGGIDLIFPHHENEIAQNRAASGQSLANYFIHGEHLLVDGRKMSKSLGNFYTLGDVTAKGFDPIAFRLLVLQAHYRSQLNFTWESLDAAQNFLMRLRAWADLRFQPNAKTKEPDQDSYELVIAKIKDALFNDLNTSQALGLLSDSVSNSETNGIDSSSFPGFLQTVDHLLGLGLLKREDIDSEAKALIDMRKKAREAKDWGLSDELRSKLAERGIEINDTPGGPIWTRTS